jgi:tetratricopeptide (TPR) repeat protein
MVLMRLARLPQDCLAAARAVAVLGDGAELPDVAALAGLRDDEVAAAVATLARAEVLRGEYPLGFVHALIRDAVYRDIPPGERELAHQRAAETLSAAHASPEQVAAHLLQVPRRGDPWTAQALLDAAVISHRRGGAESAISYLERALAEPPPSALRPRILAGLGRVQADIDGPSSLRHLREAYDLADDDQRAEIAMVLARTLVFAGAPGEATAFARSARARLAEDKQDVGFGLLAIERIAGFMHGLPPDEWMRGELPEIVGDGPGARSLASLAAWEQLILGLDRARCAELARFALSGSRLLAEDSGLFWVVAAISLEFCDEDVNTFWDEALAHAYAHGSLFMSLAAHLWRGYMLWRRGQLRESLESLRIAGEQTQMWGAPAVGAAYGQAWVIGVLLDQGETEAARAFLDASRNDARMGDGTRLFGEADAKVLYQEGRHAESVAALDRVAGLMTVVDNPCWRPWRSLRAHPTFQLGRKDEAVTLMSEELRLNRVWGASSTIGRTLRMLAEFRDPDDPAEKATAVAELTESIELLSRGRAGLQLARSHHAMGRFLSPDPSAVPHLEKALDLSRYCGARLMTGQLEAELAALGVAVPEAMQVEALTFTERSVARMAAAGEDSRSIAQALFVTPRSVETTLAALCARAGVDSPDQLGEALAAELATP